MVKQVGCGVSAVKAEGGMGAQGDWHGRRRAHRVNGSCDHGCWAWCKPAGSRLGLLGFGWEWARVRFWIIMGYWPLDKWVGPNIK